MTATRTFAALIAAAALTAGLASAPTFASARPLNTHVEARVDNRIDARIDNLSDRIRLGDRTRQLSKREAARLTGKLNDIKSLKRTYERSGRGLDRQEVALLNGKLDTLSGQVRVQAHDGNHR